MRYPLLACSQGLVRFLITPVEQVPVSDKSLRENRKKTKNIP